MLGYSCPVSYKKPERLCGNFANHPLRSLISIILAYNNHEQYTAEHSSLQWEPGAPGRAAMNIFNARWRFAVPNRKYGGYRYYPRYVPTYISAHP